MSTPCVVLYRYFFWTRCVEKFHEGRLYLQRMLQESCLEGTMGLLLSTEANDKAENSPAGSHGNFFVETVKYVSYNEERPFWLQSHDMLVMSRRIR